MTSDDALWCVLHDNAAEDCAHIKHGEKHSCGFVEDTFACKIRHIQINTGAANSNRSRWDRAAELHQNTFNRNV